MLAIPELAMPRSSKVTTVCNGKREVWTDYEQAKAYFLEMMMSADGEERDRAECIYIQLLHGLDECSDEDEKSTRRLGRNAEPFAILSDERKSSLEPSVTVMGKLLLIHYKEKALRLAPRTLYTYIAGMPHLQFTAFQAHSQKSL